MDLVASLVESIREVFNNQSLHIQGNENAEKEKQMISKEKERVAKKMIKVKQCEDDLKDKIKEFEEVFQAINEV